MKKYIYIAFCLLMVGKVSAQETQPATLQVFYNFKHQMDTTYKDRFYRERMVLWIGKTASVYHSYEKIERDSIKKNRVKDDGKGGYIIDATHRVVSNARVYKYPNEKKMMVSETLFKTYVMNVDYPEIKWTILPDTMTIAGMKCQKATGDFKGRNYTAWFAPDLPYNNGPWKLNGLPGLIIQAHDKNHEIEFMFDGIKPASADRHQIFISKEYIAASTKEYERLLTLLREDPIAFFKHNEIYGFRFVPKEPELFKKGYKKENNPIELTP